MNDVIPDPFLGSLRRKTLLPSELQDCSDELSWDPGDVTELSIESIGSCNKSMKNEVRELSLLYNKLRIFKRI